MSNVYPIWTPKDSVDTAKQFHLELDNAERGLSIDQSWFLSKSRERKSRIMDGLAVALLLALAAALGVIAVLAAAPAKADVSDSVIDYAVTYGEGAICPVLDEHHTVNGVLGVLIGVKKDGFSNFEAGQIVGLSVSEYCPRNEPLLQQFVAVYGGAETSIA
jgi:hypothetical protein